MQPLIVMRYGGKQNLPCDTLYSSHYPLANATTWERFSGRLGFPVETHDRATACRAIEPSGSNPFAFVIEVEPHLLRLNKRAFDGFGVCLAAIHARLHERTDASPVIVVADENTLLDASHRASIGTYASYAVESPPDMREALRDRFENELESGIKRCIEMRTDGNFTPAVLASDNLPRLYARALADTKLHYGRPSLKQLEPGRWYNLKEYAVKHIAEGFGASRTEMIAVAPSRRSDLAKTVLEMIEMRNDRDAARQRSKLTALSLEHRR